MTYAPDFTDLYRRAATYVDRLLRGAKESDLPVQFPTKNELVIKLKTAKADRAHHPGDAPLARGRTDRMMILPPIVVVRADEVIE